MKWYEKLFMAMIFGVAVCGCPARATSKFTPMVCEGPLNEARCSGDVDAGCARLQTWHCAPANFPRPYAEFFSVSVVVPP